jgi:Holliday junction resolvasome RuvABC endonuclease subunit
MLVIPKDSPNEFTLAALDPGSNTLGFSILTIDIATLRIVSSNATTFVGTKLAGNFSWTAEIHGDRLGRIVAHEINLLEQFRHYQPLQIASESPFYSQRRPQAFGALTEVICAIRRSVMQYDMWKDLILIDPPTVKKAVGAAGNGDKDAVKNKVLQLSDLNYNGATPLHLLDEHSIDALAVNYCQYKQLLERLCWT